MLNRLMAPDPFAFDCVPPAAPGGTAIPGPRPNVVQAPEAGHGLNIYLINWMVYDHLSEIKLIRTDTTLDLSQKAEKVCLTLAAVGLLQPRSPCLLLWDGNFETQR